MADKFKVRLIDVTGLEETEWVKYIGRIFKLEEIKKKRTLFYIRHPTMGGIAALYHWRFEKVEEE